jgi:hypothetical protein
VELLSSTPAATLGRRLAVVAGPILAAAVTALTASPSAAGGAAHYRLDAVLDLDHGRVAGHASFLPDTAAPEEIRFSMPRTHVVRKVGGGSATLFPDPANDNVQILQVKSPRRGRSRRWVTIDYEGPANASSQLIEVGLQDGWFPAPAGTPFTLEADVKGVPSRLTVFALGHVRHDGDRVRIRRAAADYDALIVAAPGLQMRRSGEVEVYSAQPDTPDSLVLQQHADAALKFVETWFGAGPRPMRVTAVDHERAGGYYESGLMVVGSKRKPPTPELYDLDAAYLMAHEFAHQTWPEFGLAPGDKWLAESIASYVGLRFAEQRFGLQKLQATLDLFRRYMPEDAGPLLSGSSREPSTPALYLKGPMLLFALEHQIGRFAMDDLLKTYARSPGRSTGTFLAALERTAGAEVAKQFERSLRDTGRP